MSGGDAIGQTKECERGLKSEQPVIRRKRGGFRRFAPHSARHGCPFASEMGELRQLLTTDSSSPTLQCRCHICAEHMIWEGRIAQPMERSVNAGMIFADPLYTTGDTRVFLLPLICYRHMSVRLLDG